MSNKPNELELSYAILLKLAGSEQEAVKLIEQAKQALKSEKKVIPSGIMPYGLETSKN